MVYEPQDDNPKDVSKMSHEHGKSPIEKDSRSEYY